MKTHRNGAMKAPRKRRRYTKRADTVQVDRLLWAEALRMSDNHVGRIEIIDAITVIIWNRDGEGIARYRLRHGR